MVVGGASVMDVVVLIAGGAMLGRATVTTQAPTILAAHGD